MQIGDLGEEDFTSCVGETPRTGESPFAPETLPPESE